MHVKKGWMRREEGKDICIELFAKFLFRVSLKIVSR